MTFTSTDAIKQYVISQSKSALMKAQEQVYQIINRFVKEFYAEFDPEMYERTYQLYCSLVKTDVESTGNGWRAYIYFDYTSLSYASGSRPSGQQVMEAASWGGHGAQGLHVITGGTAIWDEPIAALSTEAYETLRRCLLDSGIPVK